MAIYVESWAHAYGSPYLIKNEDVGAGNAEVIEDADGLRTHIGKIDHRNRTLIFVDGVRRGEASLYQSFEDGRVVHGVAGSHACGAAVVAPNERCAFGETRVKRLIIWGAGKTGTLPAVSGGWHWEARSIASDDPQAPLEELQQRMRNEEGRLAEALCDDHNLVVADGPLDFTLRRDREIVGYIKTHRRALLSPQDHGRVPLLRPSERTSIFRIGTDRYSCYLRLADHAANGPWSGIVRLEFPASGGFETVRATADDLATRLPRYAGIPHRDPRAPQNLQPIGALEWHLRHLLGPAPMAERAVREAVHILRTRPNVAEVS